MLQSETDLVCLGRGGGHGVANEGFQQCNVGLRRGGSSVSVSPRAWLRSDGPASNSTKHIAAAWRSAAHRSPSAPSIGSFARSRGIAQNMHRQRVSDKATKRLQIGLRNVFLVRPRNAADAVAPL